MTPQQQTDYKNWLENTTQELPKSLKNIFLEKCLKELCKSPKAKKLFEAYEFGFFTFEGFHKDFFNRPKEEHLTTVLFFLSRCSKGKAVLKFLDREVEIGITRYTGEIDGRAIIVDEPRMMTLDVILHGQFTEALRIGKTLNQALEIITKTYLQQIK